ncbi:MAG: RNA pseudouridine synthase [Acutalibacteraceae bacterium]
MVTDYKVLDSDGTYSLLEVHLVTGRTHQIRATMAEIGHPLVGEGKYSSRKNTLGFTHQALCAWSLTFRFEGDSEPLDYLNGRTFTVGRIPLPAPPAPPEASEAAASGRKNLDKRYSPVIIAGVAEGESFAF